MPFGDGTGPRGFGPMTGRAAGFCAVYAVPVRADFASGWACWGVGGRGWRNRYYAMGLTGWQCTGAGWGQARVSLSAPVSPDPELATLKTQTENLMRALEDIRKQTETLEAQGRKDAE